MPCGKKPLVKNWDKPRNIRVIKPSRLEKNETSVKLHWKNVIKSLEASYKDEKFWDSYCETVRQIVGPKIFRKLEKIYNLPAEDLRYEPFPDIISLPPSVEFYHRDVVRKTQTLIAHSTLDFDERMYKEEEEEVVDEEVDKWSVSSDFRRSSRSKSILRMKSSLMSSLNQPRSSTRSWRDYQRSDMSDSIASSRDDLVVHLSGEMKPQGEKISHQNPHFDMLYCNESETDMIKWKSKYKQKIFEVSASDEFSKKAEIMTKKIAKEFYDWWVDLGSEEYKSELRRPEDLEDLFQVWFDEHASRGLVLDPKIIPCVLESIANYLGMGELACAKVLKRQIKFDIHAEVSPPHTVAFASSLPQNLKHISPQNNTKVLWGPVKIPEDVKTMACVWEDIMHLTSTKVFSKWFSQKQTMPLPPILKSLEKSEKDSQKQPFVMPSDYVLRDNNGQTDTNEDLALPVSTFTLELKEVLSKLSF